MNTIKKNWKRYLVSSIDTFVTAFLLVLLANFETINIAAMDDQTLKGLLYTTIIAGTASGVRAVIKMLRESMTK